MKSFFTRRNSRRSLWSVLGIILSLFACSSGQLTAKTSSWKDGQGTAFRGEPAGVLGPWALFNAGANASRRALLRGLSPEDTRRFYEEISRRPARASSWAVAQGSATSEVIGRVLQLKGKTLGPADLASLPEPELLLALYGSHNEGEGWQMMGDISAAYHRIQRVYPGLLAAVFIGVRHNTFEHREMAIQSGMPWLVADFTEQPKLHQLTRFAPAEGTNMVLMTREGVPLLAARATDHGAVQKFVDQLSELLWQIDPTNPSNWKDRAAYGSVTRPIEFAQSRTEPLLIGSPLRAEGLRKYGVTRVNARLEIAPDGKVVATLHSTTAEVPPEWVAPLAGALQQTQVLPAIEHGVAVAGSLDYQLDVPPVERPVDAEAQWLRSTNFPALPIEQWLVLRPIKVSEQDFTSSIVDETASGTIVFKAIQVSDAKVSRAAQMSAFNTDWFTAAGASCVRPKEGEQQIIDEKSLTWERLKPVEGFINLRTGVANVDYTVGYAWAEFDSPVEGKALLGIGSDDGLKIWLNGTLIHDRWVRRPSRIDDDIVPLALKRGKNQILLKIQNAMIDWSFIYRIRLEPK